jgi:hypothetical protein
MKLVTNREFKLMEDRVADLKARIAQQDTEIAALRSRKPRAKKSEEPQKQVSEPLDSSEAQRVSRILKDGISGTKWQRRKRQIEEGFKQQPTEVVVKTGATE